MPTRYLPYEAIVDLNVQFGGPGSGVRDEDGLRGALGRIEQTMFGEDLFPTVWEKAAALTHAIASSQNFHDGNKRTALMASLMFLQLNGVEIRDLPPIQFDAFVRTMGLDGFFVEEDPHRSIKKGAEWWASAAAQPSDKVGFALLSQEVLHYGDAMYGLSLTPLVHTRSPKGTLVPVTAIFQVRWTAFDLDRSHRVKVSIEPDSPARVVYRVRPPRSEVADIDSSDYAPLDAGAIFDARATPTMSPLHSGAQPTIFTVDMLLSPQTEGTAWVRIDVDDRLFARLPINMLLGAGHDSVPDFVPESFLPE